MSCYNVQLIEYPTGYQLRVYNRVVNYSDKIDFGIKTKSSKVKTEEQKEVTHDPDRSLSSSINRTVNTIYDYARSNVWSYFLTLTIDPNKIDNSLDNYDNFTKSIRKYFNNLKTNYAPDLKYLIVPELHKDGKKLHFHALLSDVGKIKFEFSGKVSVGKYVYPIERCSWGRKIYNMPLWKLGWSTATKVEDSAKCAGYICKYITKDLCVSTKGKRRFWASLNLEKSNTRYSLVQSDLLHDFVDLYSNMVLYSKNISVEDANLSIDYYEFDKSVDLSFFDDKLPSLKDSKSQIESDQNELVKYSMEELKRLKKENEEFESHFTNGFEFDYLNKGCKIFTTE